MAIKFCTLKDFFTNPGNVDGLSFGKEFVEKMKCAIRNKYFVQYYPELKVMIYEQSVQSYYYHMLVPSEIRGNIYDIVIHFVGDTPDYIDNRTLSNYKMRFFSNNPVYAFYLGYAAYYKHFGIEWLGDKLGTEVLTTPAKINNPKNGISMDHSTYHAIKYLLENPRYMTKSYIAEHKMRFNARVLHDRIRPLEQTIAEYKNSTKGRHPELEKKFGDDRSVITKVKDTASDVAAKGKEQLDKFRKPKSFMANVVRPKKTTAKRVGTKPKIRAKRKK